MESKLDRIFAEMCYKEYTEERNKCDVCGKYWQSTNYAKEASMVQSVTYQSETKTVHFQGKSIVLESLTPVLSPKEKEKRKKEIERCLYEVFSKYRRASDTPA